VRRVAQRTRASVFLSPKLSKLTYEALLAQASNGLKRG
jgi:hypothetical protein